MHTDNLTQGQDPELLRVLLLKNCLREKGVTGRILAGRLNVSQGRLSKVLGNRRATTPYVQALRQVGVPEHLLPEEIPTTTNVPVEAVA